MRRPRVGPGAGVPRRPLRPGFRSPLRPAPAAPPRPRRPRHAGAGRLARREGRTAPQRHPPAIQREKDPRLRRSRPAFADRQAGPRRQADVPARRQGGQRRRCARRRAGDLDRPGSEDTGGRRGPRRRQGRRPRRGQRRRHPAGARPAAGNGRVLPRRRGPPENRHLRRRARRDRRPGR